MSLSASPALAPCGIPPLDDAEPEEAAVSAVPPVALWDCAAGLAADVDELEAVDPHAATPSATSTNRAAANLRAGLLVFAVISCSLFAGQKEHPVTTCDACPLHLVPAR